LSTIRIGFDCNNSFHTCLRLIAHQQEAPELMLAIPGPTAQLRTNRPLTEKGLAIQRSRGTARICDEETKYRIFMDNPDGAQTPGRRVVR
jgi:hypothetical protein